MSISPFGARPVPSGSDSHRTRLAVIVVSLGIAATLLAYAVSPGVRHAVSHAERSMKHAIVKVFDKDEGAKTRPRHPTTKTKHPAAHAERPPARAHKSGG